MRASASPTSTGSRRSDVEFGAGYVGAEDRLFFMDVLRHAGRAQLSGFAGGANKEMDKEQWENAPYNEADLQRQYDLADDVYGSDGAQLQQDVTDYVAGINAYITEARLDPNKMPVEYAAIGQPLPELHVTDPIATASLIGAIFGKGGGAEVESAQLLAAAQKRFGADRGKRVWQDFRRANDPEAPTTVHGTSFPYQVPGPSAPRQSRFPIPARLSTPTAAPPPAPPAPPAPAPARPCSGSCRCRRALERAARVGGPVRLRAPARRDGPAGRATSCRRS